MPIDPHYAIAGFLVGALVGVTGVGGGSLMTPILIVLFRVPPATAVGTDLLFAAATKTVGSVVHGFNGTVEWRIVRRLAIGSLPATVLASILLALLHLNTGNASNIITVILTLTLFLTAGVLAARNRISAACADRLSNLDDRSISIITVVIGAVLGILVTFSSIGAGAIDVTVLVLIYPRIPMARIIGSDIAHAVPLALVAGLGHKAMGSLDVHILRSLLFGSFPGIFVGSLISTRVRDLAVRYVLAAVLVFMGTKLAVDMFAHHIPAESAVLMKRTP
jgi:uncharacterized protein